jgi:hypothetical protein
MKPPRFTVRTLIVLVAFVALLLVVIVQQVQIVRLNRQVAAEQVRAETEREIAVQARYLAELNEARARFNSKKAIAPETARGGSHDDGK